MRHRATKSLLAILLLLLLGTFAVQTTSAEGPVGSVFNRQLASAGTTSLRAGGPAIEGLQFPELRPGEERAEDGGDDQAQPHKHAHRSFLHEHGARQTPSIPTVSGNNIASANPGLGANFNGINHRDNRLASGGNQFSVEPPDQALCVGNGLILEAVNQALQVYDMSGNAKFKGAVALNAFYGYAPAIVRGVPPVFGPFLTDPVCYYDPDTQRWFLVVLTLDVNPATGAFTLNNHLDIAVSNSPDPLGAWTIYRLPAQNDGTQGTPKHKDCPCIGDFPHIGADKYGFYITTNEYPWLVNTFNGAQVYAISKKALAANAAVLTIVQFDNLSAGGGPAFTMWPAIAPNAIYALDNHGIEFFLSSMAAEEAGNMTGRDNRIAVWALSNTQSLDTATPALVLMSDVVQTIAYAVPPPSNQKPGPFPLGECINDTTTVVTSLGPPFTGCWQALFAAEPHHIEKEGPLDSSDTRMMQVYYADGKLWGALDTAVNVHGQVKAGIAYFVIRPNMWHSGKVIGRVVAQGYVAVPNNNVIYPSVAVLPSGKGIMAFTLVGAEYYPSAAYVHLQAANNLGDVHVAAAGLGPQDGFSEYKAFGDPPRPRWGDYSAAVTDGNSIWFATEYIGQTCTLAQFVAAPFGSCGATRTALANWYTRIAQITPP